MRTTEAFIVGTIVGGVAVWLWGRDIAGFFGDRTRGVRATAADALQVVEEKTEQVLDGSADALRRAGGILHDTKGRVAAALRAGQDAVRPVPTTREE